jgi:hypothetical protein
MPTSIIVHRDWSIGVWTSALISVIVRSWELAWWSYHVAFARSTRGELASSAFQIYSPIKISSCE